ncbi:Protein WALLS ARE THIN 1 [Morella rubra]|uniref:Protein WALLS ARE THIN 1 n=1 Tax=Morella rubra TaxID=262757 RepID=A0A6A1UJS7_9ROSI|nr:Protein WALLS ARE THIN 1 [Morella rubra]
MHLPLRTLILAVIESIASGEEYYLGGIIGAALIVVGLYLIVWGKNQESQISIEDSVNSRESSGNYSLVQTLLD